MESPNWFPLVAKAFRFGIADPLRWWNIQGLAHKLNLLGEKTDDVEELRGKQSS